MTFLSISHVYKTFMFLRVIIKQSRSPSLRSSCRGTRGSGIIHNRKPEILALIKLRMRYRQKNKTLYIDFISIFRRKYMNNSFIFLLILFIKS